MNAKYYFSDKHIFTSRNSSSAGSNIVTLQAGPDESLNLNSDINITGDLDVTGNVDISNNLEVGGTLDVTGNVEFDSNLIVSGTTTLNSLTAGTTTLNSLTAGTTTLNSLTVTNNATVSGNTTLNNLTVTGNSALTTLNVSSNARLHLTETSYGSTVCPAGVLTKLSDWSATAGTGTNPPTFDTGTGNVTFNDTGLYFIHVTITVSAATNNYIQFRIVNVTAGGAIPLNCMVPQDGNSYTNGMSKMINIPSGTVMYVEARGTNEITVSSAEWIIQKIF